MYFSVKAVYQTNCISKFLFSWAGAEVEIYYIILFAEKVEGCFLMVLCRHMLRKSQSSHIIFSFSFLFVCALDMHCFRIIPRGKPELILENHHFTRWECGNMCQNVWVHLTSGKRGTWNRRLDSDPEEVNLSWFVLNLWAYYQIFNIPAEPGE